jgi:hypothetical protein
VANLIILIFKNGEKVPDNHNFWGVFPFSEKQTDQVGKFHHKKHCDYLSTYFVFFWGIVLVGNRNWH